MKKGKLQKKGGRRTGSKGRLRQTAVAAAVLLAAGTAVGAGYAAFSSRGEAAENVFTIQAGEAGGEIENDKNKGTGVVEPDWPTEDTNNNGVPDRAENLQPGSVVPKNPKFVSPLSYDAWVALKVEVPAASFRIAGEDADAVHDCVTLEKLNEDGRWELLNSTVSKTEGKNSVYYYGYKSIVKGKQKGETKGGETSYLFQNIRVPDITSLSLKADGTGFSGSVKVTPYAVQAEGYENVQAARGILMEVAEIKG
ncbi:MAG: hypothetical protein Q4C63_05655 [Eubacteriales bacterium]|nr:hypothetical protein [Eubacteriales bacterium]